MNIVEHYVSLRKAFDEVKEKEEVYTTTGEIADCLSCTMRNTNLIIKKFTENGWVTWFPQKGRGKKSPLIFHLTMLEACQLNIDRYIKERKLEEAYSFVTSTALSHSTKEALMNKIQNQFGLKSEVNQKGRIDILKIPQDTKVHTLDPAKVGIVHEAHIVNQIFDTLLRYDRKNRRFLPGIALAWEEKQDGREWTFYLKKGVLFHHGRILNAEDVKQTFLRLKNDKSIPFSAVVQGIVQIDILDEITVHIILREPNYMFLDLVSSFFLSIIPYDVPINEKRPVGTGPYQIIKNDEQSLVLEAFSHYFQGRPFIDRIELWQMPKYLENGEPHKKSMIEIENQESQTIRELGSFFLIFNFNKSGFHQNRHFRSALKNLFDVNQLVRDLGFPRHISASSFVMGRSQTARNFQYSLQKAKELLDQSGYNGEVITAGTFEFNEAIKDMNWLKNEAGKIGLNLKIEIIPVSEIYEGKGFKQYDLIYSGETFDENEELSLLLMYTSEISVVRMALNQEQCSYLNSLIKDMTSEPHVDNRITGFYKIEDWLREENILINTYHSVEEHNYHKTLNGIQVSGYGMPDFRHLWVKNKEEQNGSTIYIP